MSLKKKNMLFFGTIIVLFVSLYWVGTLADTPSGHTGIGHDPALSPDNKEIAFTYFKDDHGALYTAPIEGGEADRLFKPEEGKDDLRPSYSPDGKTLAFIREWEGEEHLHNQLMLHENGQVRPLLDEEEYVPYVEFAPDGEHLYFVKGSKYTDTYNDRTQPNGFDIYKMNMDTGDPEKITDLNTVSMSSLQVMEDGKQ